MGMKALDSVVDSVVMKLKRREIKGSGACSTQTAELLRTVVSRGKFSSVQDLLDIIRMVGKTLQNAQPMELAIGNTVRRVLFFVRHECAIFAQEEKKGTSEDIQQVDVDLSLSLHRLLDTQVTEELDFSGSFHARVKQPIIEEITQLMEEVRHVYTHIAEQAPEHVYAKEVILTHGVSRTVLNFLKEAKFRPFEVIVAESAPSCEGQRMAVLLAQMGIQATVISDAAVFAMMAQVNKVVVGTHAVLANGGLIGHTGAHNIAVAAKHHNIPYIVLSGLHKLCPLYAFDQDTFNESQAPSQVLKFEEQDLIENVRVMNPGFDYVPPDLVTLFITNFGGHSPSYIYRLLSEYYNAEDYEL